MHAAPAVSCGDLCAVPPLLCFQTASGWSFSMHFLAAFFVVLLAMLPASAQVAPTEAELRAYGGLHAAAARGDVVDMEKRIGSGETRKRSTVAIARRCMSPSTRRSTMPPTP